MCQPLTLTGDAAPAVIDAHLHLQQSTQLLGFAHCCQKPVWGQQQVRDLPLHGLWLQEDCSATAAGTLAPLLRGAPQWCNKVLNFPAGRGSSGGSSAPPAGRRLGAGQPPWLGWRACPPRPPAGRRWHAQLAVGPGLGSGCQPPKALVRAPLPLPDGRPGSGICWFWVSGENADCTSGGGALSRVPAAKDRALLGRGAGPVFSSEHPGPDRVLP